MMKYRMRAALLAGLIFMSLAGCAAKSTANEKARTDSHNQTVTADVTSSENMTNDITAKTESAEDTVTSATAEKQTAEKESNAPLNSEYADTEKPVSSPPVKNQVPEPPNPAPSEPPKQTEPPKKEESKPATPPVTVPPAEQEPSEPEPTEPPAPAFDIDYWISYAQSYAASVGLRLESSAVDCWDNPIIAGAHCAYLERDIESRLNRYKRDEDVTDVWIWAEPRADGSYDLYIGYA